MEQKTIPQLSKLLDHDKPEAVLAEVEHIFTLWYPSQGFLPILRAYELVRSLYSGGFPGYQACNTEYHNLHHTMDVLIAAARLMDGHALKYQPLPQRQAENLLLAALLHDSGYIQEKGDSQGTGAKYTACHVSRGVRFTLTNARRFDLSQDRAIDIGRIIECTNLQNLPPDLEFSDSEAQIAGAILGTADLLGQMGDRAYLEKLLFLYYEFREAGFPGYNTEFDILKNTLSFYDKTRTRLEEGLHGIHDLCRTHFKERFDIDKDLYIESIEHQMDYLRRIMEDDSSNFRKKLHRIDLENLSSLPA